MIVDDEVLAIEYLKDLISWEKYGFEIVAEAYNGKKAIELYQKHRPQIIIADISMPGMNGLELSSEIIKYDDDIKIILLTSYKDFEYAKKAVKIGVFDYILKHELNEESILEELQRVKAKIQDYEKVKRLKTQEIIKKLLEGKKIKDEARQYINNIMGNNSQSFMLLLIKQNIPYPVIQYNINEYIKDIEDNNTLFDLDNYKILENVHYIESIKIKDNLYAILLSIKNIRSQKEIYDTYYQIITEIKDKYKRLSNSTLCVAVTRILNSNDGFSKAFNRAEKILKYSLFFDKEKILRFEDIPHLASACDKTFTNEFKDIKDKMHKFDQEGVKKVIASLFDNIVSPYWDLQGFKNICKGLIFTLESFRKNNGIISLEEMLIKKEVNIDSWYNFKDINSWFVDEFRDTIIEVQQSNLKSYSKKIQMVIWHIQKHYAEDLVVEKVAEEVGISGIYLSQLFKKETGKTFLTYLTDYRIESAKALLGSNKYNVNEVADLVGYSTSQYFSKIFHKATGVTPKYYMTNGEKY
jgi:Response regulator containing CheY-like receiver domain and AraC-type DNA-binding domain